MFASIDTALLACVVGGADPAPGPNRTTIDSPDTKVSSSRTDYGYCVDKVQQMCDRTSWTRGGAAQCTLDNIAYCPGAGKSTQPAALPGQ